MALKEKKLRNRATNVGICCITEMTPEMPRTDCSVTDPRIFHLPHEKRS